MNNFVTEKCNTCEQCKSELKQVEDKKICTGCNKEYPIASFIKYEGGNNEC